MFSRIFLFFLAFIPWMAVVEAGTEQSTKVHTQNSQSLPKIRVLITHDQEKVLLQVVGKYRIFDPYLNTHISTRFKGKSQDIQAIQNGLKWGEEFPGVHQLQFLPASPDTKLLVNGIEYDGSIYVFDIGGSISIVNELPLEEYLGSVLANHSQPLANEVLAALVIVARTNAYNQIQNPRSSFWAADAAQTGYKGVFKGELPLPLQKAIKSTQYMVLSFSKKSGRNVITLPLQWDAFPKNLLGNVSPRPEASKISLAEANELSKKGAHAATILEKAFPKASIQLIYQNL
jgi:stage II sporulation protein D